MNNQGVVFKVENEVAFIRVPRKEACGSNCEACAGCGSHENVTIVEVDNHLGANVGDLVELKGDSNKIMKYSFIMYAVPLILFVAGIVLGNYLLEDLTVQKKELYSFFIGLLALILSWIGLKFFDENAFNSKVNMIRLNRIIK